MSVRGVPTGKYYGGGRAKGQLNGAGKRNRIAAIEERQAARAKIVAIEQQAHILATGLLVGAVAKADLYDAVGEHILVYTGEELTLQLLSSLPPELLRFIQVPPAIENAVVEAYSTAINAIDALQSTIKPKRKGTYKRPFGR